MLDQATSKVAELVRAAAHPLAGAPHDYDALIDLIGDARIVLIGEASHGTHEFYRERAQITRRLIAERGFAAVAVEADWPDAYQINRYVRGETGASGAIEALEGFQRFPTWMWRNADVLDFAGWLRAHNDALPRAAAKAGFYGLDLYSLHASIAAVISYLEHVDPPAAQRARERYGCLEYFGSDPQIYGYATSLGEAETCEDEVVGQLVELRRHTAELLQGDGQLAEDAFFSAEQNARLAKNAEAYYRAMFRGRNDSWNLRDRHMAETLEALAAHLSRAGAPAKLVVWAHNSHLGDARATQMGEHGELNVGQLVRERYAGASVSIGFSTYQGTVAAASDWDGPAEIKQVRPALPGSYEALFHDTRIARFLLRLRDSGALAEGLRARRLERAIGVIYRPATERASHYFYARLPEQFDAIIHIDTTRAVEPLERLAEQQVGELPETYPTGQ